MHTVQWKQNILFQIILQNISELVSRMGSDNSKAKTF